MSLNCKHCQRSINFRNGKPYNVDGTQHTCLADARRAPKSQSSIDRTKDRELPLVDRLLDLKFSMSRSLHRNTVSEAIEAIRTMNSVRLHMLASARQLVEIADLRDDCHSLLGAEQATTAALEDFEED